MEAAERAGQLEVRGWEEAHLRDGHFDQNRMLSLIQEVLNDRKAKGFPLSRLLANMEWALEDRPGVNDIVEYETRLNYILRKSPGMNAAIRAVVRTSLEKGWEVFGVMLWGPISVSSQRLGTFRLA